MRLHRLTFAGLGPFRDEQVIDFADLAASGLFLLEGPTGAGKSTIIDAIVFALYGTVAGAESDKGRLVSQFLDGSRAPFAELVFQTGAGIHRIRRTPTYEARKARGTGTTTRNATVTLLRLDAPDDEAGEPLTTSLREAGDEVNRIVGLTKDQFISTMVLPQGEFARFLQAEGKERLPILQRIFRTEPYERLQRRLWEAKGEAERARAQACQAVELALAGFHGAAGSDPDTAPWHGLDLRDGAALDAALDAALRGLDALAREAGRGAQGAAESLRLATAAHQGVLDRVRRRDRLAQATARAGALEAAAPEHLARVARLAAAERAERVADALAAEATASAAFDLAAGADEAARSALPQGQQGLTIGGLREALDLERERAAGLAPVVEVEAGLPALASALEQGRACLADERARVAEQDRALRGIPARQASLSAERDAATARAALVGACEQEVERAGARRTAAEQLAEAGRELDAARGAQVAAMGQLQEAEAAARSLADRYRMGLAAELGSGLQPDEPCPVCGSCTHPAPARPDADHVPREQVEHAELVVRAVRDRVEQCRAAVAGAEQRVVRHAAQAEGLDLEAAGTALQQAQAELARARAGAVAAAALDDALAELEAEQRRCTEARTAALAAAAGLEAQLTALAAQQEADEAVVAQARAEHPTVAARAEALARTIVALEAAQSAAAGRATADEALARARAALTTALQREAFEDADAARAALLDPQRRGALEAQVRAHEAEAAQVAAVLAEPELADVDLDEALDPAPAATAVAAASAEQEAALAAQGQARARLADAAGQAASVRAAVQERDLCLAQTEPLLQVARLAWGHNALSMNLATYVVQRRFETVVAAANEHLRHMSDGTLELVATEDAEGRSTRAGLGLRVVDLRTGLDRGTRTLSGGETFYTSLALALGLAAVVAGEAGGVQLGTLFVDEGFGSLGGRTLDDVMSVLTALGAGGRVIGVVSHVEEMKQRIPERIEVRRDGLAGHSAIRVVA